MIITRQLFLAIIYSPNEAVVTALDKAICGCGYCYHWVYKMGLGRFNPLQNEMDAELKDIKTAEQLYKFVKDKNTKNMLA